MGGAGRKIKREKKMKSHESGHRNDSFGLWSHRGQGRDLKQVRDPRRGRRGHGRDPKRDLRPHGSPSRREL